MVNDSYARTAAGMFDTINRRLTSVERRLPASLRDGLSVTGDQVTDWNDVTETGFYWSDNASLNRPANTSFMSGIVYTNSMDGFDRVVQELRIPSSAFVRNSFVRIGSWTDGVLTWGFWRRSDGLMIPTSYVGGGWDGSVGRFNMNTGSKLWSLNGVFTADFRSYRIMFSYWTGSPNGGRFQLRANGVDETANEYYVQTLYITGTGTPAGGQSSAVNNGAFPAQSAYGFQGEIQVTEPMYTAGNNNQKRINSEWTPYASLGGGGGWNSSKGYLNARDTIAYDGFTLQLSDQAGAGVTAAAHGWIAVKGEA